MGFRSAIPPRGRRYPLQTCRGVPHLSTARDRRTRVAILYMDKPVLQAALRVLMSLENGTCANAFDVDLVRGNALPGERDVELDDLARAVAGRAMDRR
jgi:hypothetical protein